MKKLWVYLNHSKFYDGAFEQYMFIEINEFCKVFNLSTLNLHRNECI